MPATVRRLEPMSFMTPIPADASLRTQEPRAWVTRGVLILAVLGFALRLILLGQPLVEENSHVRQTQTAMATQQYAERGLWPPETRATWRGTLPAVYVQEVPLYNYLVVAVNLVTGNLDAAGRLTSALLWLASFFVLQGIWVRYLPVAETFWANVLFVLAPLSIAYGQVVMPEMLVQLSAFGFVVLFLRYLETPTLLRLVAAGLVGLVGVTVKLPEVSHLYVLFFVMLLLRDSWRAFLRVRYWVMMIATAVTLKLWGSYADAASMEYFRYWSASENLVKFTTKLTRLFELKYYVIVPGYLVVFILTPVGVALVVWGLVHLLRRYGWRHFILLWCFSLAFFYLLWGPRTAFTHAYYNLPSLAPICALVGFGTVAFLAWTRRLAPVAGHGLRTAAAVLFLAAAAFGTYYLMRPTLSAYNAGMWLRENTEPGAVILSKSNHINNLSRYRNYPALPYFSGRQVWVWDHDVSGATSEEVMASSQWFVELVEEEEGDPFLDLRRKLKSQKNLFEDMTWLTSQPGVAEVHRGNGFVVYRLEQTPRLPDAR